MSKEVAPLSGSPPPAASNVPVLCDLSIYHITRCHNTDALSTRETIIMSYTHAAK